MYRPHTWVEIDFDCMAYNLNLLKEKLKKGAKIIGVVKADAYGFGAIEVSRFLVAQGVDMIAVSVLTEGIELRRAGITVPILIFNYVGIDNYDMLFHYNLTPTVYCWPFAKALNSIAQSWDKKINVHINIDTGMSRLGVMMKELPDFLKQMEMLEYLNVEAMYSHFSTADSDDLTYTNSQQAKFEQAKRVASEYGYQDIHFHIANSAALMRSIACDYEFVRIGAALYGFNPKENMLGNQLSAPLKSTLTFKTLIGFMKKVEKGIAVGYGATYVTKRETVIATLPVGYADGVRRTLSNRGEVLVRGQRAKIIGIIAMDQLMIDVTDIQNVKTGDEVVIIGKQGHDEISLAEVAKMTDTISYEVPALINRRVPRYYMKNDRAMVVRGHIDNL